MQEKLNIPKTIRVGFQNRTDTYTGKLAYIVYVDDKGKLRKEKSWEGWRDKKIDPTDYPNEPTNGFVLNRDVGGTQRSWSWNARREKVRVFDPRSFEFEISVENLLFILQECSAIKGKGLEGEFVYSWSGQELVLLPVSSQEYKNATEFSVLKDEKVASSDVVPGCTYLTKDKDEVMYLGRFPWFTFRRSGYNSVVSSKKQHVFVYTDKKSDSKGSYRYWVQSGFTNLAHRISGSPISQFADEFERLSNSIFVSPPSKLVLCDKIVSKSRLDSESYYSDSICIIKNNQYYIGTAYRWRHPYPQETSFYKVDCSYIASIKNGIYTVEWTNNNDRDKNFTLEEVQSLVRDLYVECENGARFKAGGNYEQE